MAPFSGPQEVPLDTWRPMAGDELRVDTKENIGYLIHQNGNFTQFPVVTGQNRTVSYIGRTYRATTPTNSWVAMTREIKGDRWTFGPSGRFLRLFIDGEERTAYGIHEFAEEDEVFSGDDRFRSMGCIIVRKSEMDIIDRTFSINEGTIKVSTEFGIDPATVGVKNTETILAQQ